MRSLAALKPLLDGHWYDALYWVLDAQVRKGDEDPRVLRARQLAAAARRVLDLDAEDYGLIASEFGARRWGHQLTSMCFPLVPRGENRGALSTLAPLYALMLEVLDLRALRHEAMQVVVTSHLIGEYLPQLAWESTLGHAGDPLRIGRQLGERWGTADPACPHNSALRAAAKRAMNACAGDLSGYTAYLDRFHSRQGAALAICAMNHDTVNAGDRPDVGVTCPNPCSWAVRGTLEERRSLDARVRLALIYRDSPLVALRHHAPVGHFFGVPSTVEISEAWLKTWAALSCPWPDGGNPLLTVPAAPDSIEALPGMSALVSAVAGRTIGPGHLIRAIGDEIAGILYG